MSSEIAKIRGADGVRLTGRQYCGASYIACASQALRSRRPQACMETSRARTRDPVAIRGRKAADRWEKAISYKAHRHGNGESHSGIVPTKGLNTGQGGPPETVEGRPLTKENAGEPNPYWMQGQESGPSGLDRVSQAAQRDKQLRLTALLRHVTIDLLRSSYYDLKRRAPRRPPRAYPSWGLSRATVAESLDRQRRWAETAIGDRGTGRQNRPECGGAGSQPDRGRGLSGLFLRVPAGA